MTGAHYTDASGLASSTVSTAADEVRLGIRAACPGHGRHAIHPPEPVVAGLINEYHDAA